MTADVDRPGGVRSQPFLALPGVPASARRWSTRSTPGSACWPRVRRRRVHPRPLRHRGPRRPALARAGVAAAGRRRPPARPAAARAARRCTASAIRCSSRRSPAATRCWFLRRAAGGQDARHQPDDRASAAPAASSRPRCSWARCSAPPTATSLTHLLPGLAGAAGAYGLVGMGAVFAGAGTRADHRGDHHLRAHRRLPASSCR